MVGRQGQLTGRARRVPRRSDRGQSLVEFVLVLPILLVMIFGIIEFANAWRTAQIITTVTRDVVRFSVLPVAYYNPSWVTDTADQRLSASGLDPAKATITIKQCNTGIQSGDCTGLPDTVRISYPYSFQFFGPVLGLMCGSGCGAKYGTVNISSTAVMRNE